MSDPNDDYKNDLHKFIARGIDLGILNTDEARRICVLPDRRGKSTTAAILAATYSSLQGRSAEGGQIAFVGITEDEKALLPDRGITVWVDEFHSVKVEAVPVKSSRKPKEERPWVKMKKVKTCPRK